MECEQQKPRSNSNSSAASDQSSGKLVIAESSPIRATEDVVRTQTSESMDVVSTPNVQYMSRDDDAQAQLPALSPILSIAHPFHDTGSSDSDAVPRVINRPPKVTITSTYPIVTDCTASDHDEQLTHEADDVRVNPALNSNTDNAECASSPSASASATATEAGPAPGWDVLFADAYITTPSQLAFLQQDYMTYLLNQQKMVRLHFASLCKIICTIHVLPRPYCEFAIVCIFVQAPKQFGI